MVCVTTLPVQPFSLDLITGHIVSCRVLGYEIVVLNTIQAIKDLLEKRGSIYSDRPVVQLVDM